MPFTKSLLLASLFSSFLHYLQIDKRNRRTEKMNNDSLSFFIELYRHAAETVNEHTTSRKPFFFFLISVYFLLLISLQYSSFLLYLSFSLCISTLLLIHYFMNSVLFCRFHCFFNMHK